MGLRENLSDLKGTRKGVFTLGRFLIRQGTFPAGLQGPELHLPFFTVPQFERCESKGLVRFHLPFLPLAIIVSRMTREFSHCDAFLS